MKKLYILLLAFTISACASFDGQLTKFHPLRQQDNHQVYLFTTSANFVYPLDSAEAEKTRIGWLEQQLRNHGLDDQEYTILKRKVVPADGGAVGAEAYHLYYEVLTKENKNT